MQRRIGFSATSKFRTDPGMASDLRAFILRHMHAFGRCGIKVVCTEGTLRHVRKCLDSELSDDDLAAISLQTGLDARKRDDRDRWRQVCLANLTDLGSDLQGMIEITHELICGQLDGVIHLADSDSLAMNVSCVVLRRQADNYNIPVASDVATAMHMARVWIDKSAHDPGAPSTNGDPNDPIAEISEGLSTIALIAHNAKKIEMANFVVRWSKEVLEYKTILATGTTGAMVRDFLLARGHSSGEISKIRRCRSGPDGGDVQIATAVNRGLCKTVVFFQDASSNHPHEPDIRLFENCLAAWGDVIFLRNPASAEMVLARAASR